MKRILMLSALALSVSACTVTPKPLTTGSLSKFASDSLARVTAGQQPVTNAIDLYEAMARALKYNLDFHVELYNEALASKQLEAARLDTLPNLIASAAYTGRNNDSGNLGSSVFPDREKFQNDINLSWNILDFGLSKVRAEQAADEVLVARENRRKIINRVIEDVRTSYWRAVSADRLVVGLRRLEGRTKRAMANAKALEDEGQTSPLTSLTYQRELVEIQQRIQRLQKDLSLAKMQLAALMNIRPGEHFTLAQPARRATSTDLVMTGEEMVFAALENRPEIRDIQYKLRINSKEARRAFLQMLPNANLFATANFDSDNYLYNSNWVGWGAKATWNLLSIFKYPAQKRAIEAQSDVLDQRALAVTMAIMTQVHVSRVRYRHSKKLYLTAAKHLRVQKRIVQQIRASHAEEQASEQTLIREEMNTLASQVSSDIAYADLQNAYANIYASMGIDPYADDLRHSHSVEELAASLRNVWIERGDNSGAIRAHRSAKAHRVTDAMATHGIRTGSSSGQHKQVVTGSVQAAPASQSGWQNFGSQPVASSAAPRRASAPQRVNVPAKKKVGFFAALARGGDRSRPLREDNR
ncbi:MAG: TolC family protein [Pseudomonadota bacterium]